MNSNINYEDEAWINDKFILSMNVPCEPPFDYFDYFDINGPYCKTDILDTSNYGYNIKYNSKEEAITIAKEISISKKKSVFVVETSKGTCYVKVPHDGKEINILKEIENNIKNKPSFRKKSKCYYIEYVKEQKEQSPPNNFEKNNEFTQPNNFEISQNTTFTVTPISKNNKPKGKPDSKRDYEEQIKLVKNGNTWMWDDAKKNESKIGGIFGFVFNDYHVVFHKIIKIDEPINRLESWADNIGQSDRKVLYLSNPIVTILWPKWLELTNLKKIQGSMYPIQNKIDMKKLIDFLNK
jgi:hypothetical protein